VAEVVILAVIMPPASTWAADLGQFHSFCPSNIVSFRLAEANVDEPTTIVTRLSSRLGKSPFRNSFNCKFGSAGIDSQVPETHNYGTAIPPLACESRINDLLGGRFDCAVMNCGSKQTSSHRPDRWEVPCC
jgi:hypothetical protein